VGTLFLKLQHDFRQAFDGHNLTVTKLADGVVLAEPASPGAA
jgi:hypothetical protein